MSVSIINRYINIAAQNYMTFSFLIGTSLNLLLSAVVYTCRQGSSRDSDSGSILTAREWVFPEKK